MDGWMEAEAANEVCQGKHKGGEQAGNHSHHNHCNVVVVVVIILMSQSPLQSLCCQIGSIASFIAEAHKIRKKITEIVERGDSASGQGE